MVTGCYNKANVNVTLECIIIEIGNDFLYHTPMGDVASNIIERPDRDTALHISAGHHKCRYDHELVVSHLESSSEVSNTHRVAMEGIFDK